MGGMTIRFLSFIEPIWMGSNSFKAIETISLRIQYKHWMYLVQVRLAYDRVAQISLVCGNQRVAYEREER